MNFYETALDSIGIYPKSTTKGDVTTERTEWQEGWNACVSKIIDKVEAFEKWFYSLEENQRTLLDRVEDYLYVKNFIGKRKGENDRILWYDILKIDEYKQEGFEHNKKEGGEDDSN